MRERFFKALGLGIIGYVLLYFSLFEPWALGAIGVAWTSCFLFCAWRLVQGIRYHWYRVDAAEWDREAFGLALGGVVATLLFVPPWLATPYYCR